MDVYGLAQQCSPDVAPTTIAAIVTVESSHNPYAIGVVGGALERQPRTLAEALSTIASLVKQGRNFSMGLAQVNRYNLAKHNINYAQVFDPCVNLKVGAAILKECYMRANKEMPDPQLALRAAFSCYYSGNFTRGFKPDRKGELSYVDKVVRAAGAKIPQLPAVPAITWSNGVTPAPVTVSVDQPTVLTRQFRVDTQDATLDALAKASTKAEAEANQAIDAKSDGDSVVVF